MARAGVSRVAAALGVVVCTAAPGPGSPQVAGDDAVELVASREGFQPSSLRLRRGETTRLRLRSADGEHCFAVDTLRVEKRVVPGRATLVDLTPDQAGSFSFYCCLETGRTREVESGTLIVVE